MDKKYLILFTAISDALEELDRLRDKLIVAQRRAEDAYLKEDNGTGEKAAVLDISCFQRYN